MSERLTEQEQRTIAAAEVWRDTVRATGSLDHFTREFAEIVRAVDALRASRQRWRVDPNRGPVGALGSNLVTRLLGPDGLSVTVYRNEMCRDEAMVHVLALLNAADAAEPR